MTDALGLLDVKHKLAAREGEKSEGIPTGIL